MLEKEYRYYEEHIGELKKNYLNKFVVIVGDSVIGAYNTQAEALSENLKTYEIGTFFIQEISENPTQNIHRYTSRVYV